jgi:hypothetical protein
LDHQYDHFPFFQGFERLFFVHFGPPAHLFGISLLPLSLCMGLREEHWAAMDSAQLATVQAFVRAHPEMLNEVRSGSRREEGEEEEEKEKNSPLWGCF